MTEHRLIDGQVTFWTSRPSAKEPQPHAIQCTLKIDGPRVEMRDFRMDRVTDIEHKLDKETTIKVAMEVTLIEPGSGNIDRATGQLHVDCRLFCQFYHLFPWPAMDAELALRVTTGSAAKPDGTVLTGLPIQADGSVAVVGDGRFDGDELGDVRCGLRITGRLVPSPA